MRVALAILVVANTVTPKPQQTEAIQTKQAELLPAKKETPKQESDLPKPIQVASVRIENETGELAKVRINESVIEIGAKQVKFVSVPAGQFTVTATNPERGIMQTSKHDAFFREGSNLVMQNCVIRRAAETAAACGCRVGTPTRQGLPCGGSRP